MHPQNFSHPSDLRERIIVSGLSEQSQSHKATSRDVALVYLPIKVSLHEVGHVDHLQVHLDPLIPLMDTSRTHHHHIQIKVTNLTETSLVEFCVLVGGLRAVLDLVTLSGWGGQCLFVLFHLGRASTFIGLLFENVGVLQGAI